MVRVLLRYPCGIAVKVFTLGRRQRKAKLPAKIMQEESRGKRLQLSATVDLFGRSRPQCTQTRAAGCFSSITERFKVLSLGQGGGRRSRAMPEHSKSDSGINGDLIFLDNSH